ncbi:MAG: hypothetical protein ACHQD9_09315 [Chitinophagales bacterium]
MNSMINELILYYFQINHRVTHQNIDSITHEESLVFGLKGGSCINRVLGHMTVTRDKALELLKTERCCPTEMYEKYKRGSVEITAETAMNFHEIISFFNQSQSALEKTIASFNFTDLDFTKKIEFFAFHEGYHVGQLGIMRRFVGKA